MCSFTQRKSLEHHGDGAAFLATESWKEALDDAKQVISLDSSSPWGYEVKRAASYKTGKYDDAVHAFEAMLSRMAQYPTRTCSESVTSTSAPSTRRATIVQRTLRHSPRVLINTIPRPSPP
ncbi:hypothetical protein L210DRAFT_985169 [Boletus edulis BED1]|uniref:Uncharacterized protein n=1 Tax=Boletus edulis BED1 TaxID=1328754 RepID=A0AAD4BEQ2_BOLED|nr:hypothetical protein L210DRAFT_985169 [Boletus edulis BED1]